MSLATSPRLVSVPRYPSAPRRAELHLASNESALGPSPAALAAAREAVGASYPSPDAAPLRLRLAREHGVSADEVLVTNGSTEAIVLLARAFPGEVLCPVGSFPMYARAAAAAGSRLRLTARRPDGSVDLDALSASVTPATTLIFIANPDNPTGTTVRGLADWLRSLPANVVPVVDEAYVELCTLPADELLGAHPNLVVLRSFSKAYGLASLRVGYAVASVAIITVLDGFRDPFNVNAPAQAAAVAALDDQRWLARVCAHTARGREQLAAGLRNRGYTTLPSEANFVFVPAAGDLVEVLAEEGIGVRDLAPWGFPGAARITVGTDAQHERLFAALDLHAFACAS